jgi:type IV pilus assembly protein PilA
MIKKLRKRRNQKGFTLIDILISIAIIGILAAIAIPQFNSYRAKGYVTLVRSDVRNAFTAATAYFSDNQAATALTLANLQDYGFRSTPPVTVTVTSGSWSTFSLIGTSPQITGSYIMDANGVIMDTLTR